MDDSRREENEVIDVAMNNALEKAGYDVPPEMKVLVIGEKHLDAAERLRERGYDVTTVAEDATHTFIAGPQTDELLSLVKGLGHEHLDVGDFLERPIQKFIHDIPIKRYDDHMTWNARPPRNRAERNAARYKHKGKGRR